MAFDGVFLAGLKLFSIPAGKKVVGPVLLDWIDVIEAKGDWKVSENYIKTLLATN